MVVRILQLLIVFYVLTTPVEVCFGMEAVDGKCIAKHAIMPGV